MKIRKLKKEEHPITRRLWEEIFLEDGKAFLDYYYHVKAAENTIYVVENDKEVPVSMLHLNPYEVCLGDHTAVLHYIVAVATKEEERGKGYMASLLKTAADSMYRSGEPFTFLMPAAEAIYYPHGFRFIYRQHQISGTLKGGESPKDSRTCVRPAKEEDCGELARVAETKLKQSESIHACRTAHYYRVLLQEQQSEGGKILIAEREGRICGSVLCHMEAGKAELREPLFENGEDMGRILDYLQRNSVQTLQVSGIPSGEEVWIKKHLEEVQEQHTPMIMARVIHLKQFLEQIRAKADFSICMQVEDTMLPENSGCWKITGRRAEKLTVQKVSEQEGERLTVGELTTAVFGYATERGEEPKKELQDFLEGIDFLPPVFLNEIV